MYLSHTFSSNLSRFTVIGQKNTLESIDNYMQMIIYNTINYLTKKNTFGILQVASNPRKYIISIKNEMPIFLIIYSDYFTVEHNKTLYEFTHSYTAKGGVINLRKVHYQKLNYDITEEYAPHLVTLVIKKHNTQFEFRIPYDTNERVEMPFLSKLNSEANLNLLKNIYMVFFAPNQDRYNFRSEVTTLSIKDLNQEKNLQVKAGENISYEHIIDLDNIKIKVNKEKDSNSTLNIAGLGEEFPPILNNYITMMLTEAEKLFTEKKLSR